MRLDGRIQHKHWSEALVLAKAFSDADDCDTTFAVLAWGNTLAGKKRHPDSFQTLKHSVIFVAATACYLMSKYSAILLIDIASNDNPRHIMYVIMLFAFAHLRQQEPVFTRSKIK